MANRQRFPVRARRAPSRKTWAGISSGTSWTTLAANTTVIVGSLVTTGQVTLLRTRGLMAILSDAEVEEEIQGALGMAVVSEDAFNAGAASMPDPIADIDSDSWVLWQPFQHARALGTATGQSPANSEYVLDSKAMRKFHADERVALLLANNNATFGMRFHIILRSLVRLGA